MYLQDDYKPKLTLTSSNPYPNLITMTLSPKSPGSTLLARKGLTTNDNELMTSQLSSLHHQS
jgi:hypothetical protein